MVNKYEELYNSKKISIEDALSMIKSGNEVAVSCCSMEPTSILNSLHTLRDRVKCHSYG